MNDSEIVLQQLRRARSENDSFGVCTDPESNNEDAKLHAILEGLQRSGSVIREPYVDGFGFWWRAKA